MFAMTDRKYIVTFMFFMTFGDTGKEGGPGCDPKPYECIGFGDLDGPRPYEFIGFGDLDRQKIY